MEIVSQSRRKFITTITLLVVSAGLLVRYLTPLTSRNRRALVNANTADVPINGALVFRSERLAVLRTEEGLYALSLVCSHLGCTVIVAEEFLTCPCHGSKFDRQGAVVTGPADKPLVKLELVEQNGKFSVYGS